MIEIRNVVRSVDNIEAGQYDHDKRKDDGDQVQDDVDEETDGGGGGGERQTNHTT